MTTQDLKIEEHNGVRFCFFWKGWISNWALTPFVPVDDSFMYVCVEQYMMAKKAEYFEDAETLKKILMSTQPSEHKRLGRLVKGYDEEVWDAVRETVVLTASLYKYRQHPNLCDALLRTGDAELAEANPHDKLWGIGMAANDPERFDRSQWGENLLGKVLMRARRELRLDREHDSLARMSRT